MPTFPPLPSMDAGGEAWRAYVGLRDARWSALNLRTVGAYEAVVGQRAETADCLDRERAAGRIR